MKLSKQTAMTVLTAIEHLIRYSQINGSGSIYDFTVSRLRIATTQPNLLSTLNRLQEVLGSDLLPQELITDVLRASASSDATVCLQWLREQPSIAIGLVRLKQKTAKDAPDFGNAVNHLVESYAPLALTQQSIKQRRGFSIAIKATVTQALSHGDEIKAGNATLFRRCQVIGGQRLPFYSGNALVGQMRDLLADHFLASLGFKLDKSSPQLNIWFFHMMYSGGIMADGNTPKEFDSRITTTQAGVVNTSGMRELRNMIPFFSVLGGVAKYPMNGYLYVNDLRPECVEWGNGNVFINQLVDWRFMTRRDDLEIKGKSKGKVKEGEEQAEGVDNTSMIVNVECLTEGTVLEGGVDVSDHISNLELSVVAKGLKLLAEKGYLGGKKARGFGRVEIDYSTELQLDDGALYDEYLENNKEDILAYLKAINALIKQD